MSSRHTIIGYRTADGHTFIEGRCSCIDCKEARGELPPRETNPLGILCVECWQECTLSEDRNRWLCPNGHDNKR
jgi:hypothetical protein